MPFPNPPQHPALSDVPALPKPDAAWLLDLLVEDPGNPGSTALDALEANPQSLVLAVDDTCAVLCRPTKLRVGTWIPHTPLAKGTPAEVEDWVLAVLADIEANPSKMETARSQVEERTSAARKAHWDAFNAFMHEMAGTTP